MWWEARSVLSSLSQSVALRLLFSTQDTTPKRKTTAAFSSLHLFFGPSLHLFFCFFLLVVLFLLSLPFLPSFLLLLPALRQIRDRGSQCHLLTAADSSSTRSQLPTSARGLPD